MERQPLVRPLPLVVFLAVGSVLVLSSIPLIQNPTPPRPIDRGRSA